MMPPHSHMLQYFRHAIAEYILETATKQTLKYAKYLNAPKGQMEF